MCTAVAYKTKDHYFGRNLDLEFSYNETVTVTPRNYPFEFRHAGTLATHYAMIGMAFVMDGYPLYYDATNEKGLSIAGLNFPENARYLPVVGSDDVDDIAPFELIPWLLGTCATVAEARKALERINVCDTSFSEQMPASPEHWMLDDGIEQIVVEPLADGLRVYDNPVGVMTNNPTFDVQLLKLTDYLNVNAGQGENRLIPGLDMDKYSRGMGTCGLPGGLDSAGRFVKVAFTRNNSVCDGSEEQSVSQFFHILQSVCQQRGCCDLGDGKYEITIYSSCVNADKGIYYYTTYDNSAVNAVDMYREDLDGTQLAAYPLVDKPTFSFQN